MAGTATNLFVQSYTVNTTFNLSGTVNGDYIVPVGVWALPSGLLIYASGNNASFNPTEYTTVNTGTGPESGHWYILTGPSPASGTLNYLGPEVGPICFSLGTTRGVLSLLRQAGIPNGHVVDLGCGSGSNLRALRAAELRGELGRRLLSEELLHEGMIRPEHLAELGEARAQHQRLELVVDGRRAEELRLDGGE